jgi:hypothetical protein
MVIFNIGWMFGHGVGHYGVGDNYDDDDKDDDDYDDDDTVNVAVKSPSFPLLPLSQYSLFHSIPLTKSPQP